MPEEPVKAERVAAWVDGVLADYKGRYEVVDHLFVRDAVRVVTIRRDSFYDIPRQRWLADPDSDLHQDLGQELRTWARKVMPNVAQG